MSNDKDYTELVCKVITQAQETEQEFAYTLISPFCERIVEKKLSKKELEKILRKGMQPSIPLDKVKQAREKIENLRLHKAKYITSDNKVCIDSEAVLEILDKMMEDGGEMEKHTDRQIYDGCIHLMQKMVDYFKEYLEYLGYDLDKIDEDDMFAVGISNMEIVRWLFLFHTRNSGGCSTREFCEKIGIDPYKSVKFEFERGEE